MADELLKRLAIYEAQQQKETEIEKINQSKLTEIMCPMCNLTLIPTNGNFHACPECGFMKEVANNLGYSNIVHYNHNVSSNSTSYLKLENCNKNDMSRFRKLTTINSNIKKKLIENKLENLNIVSNIKFPPDVIKSARDIAHQILSKSTRRNSPRAGIMAACIKYICMKDEIGISRRDIEYANFTGVPEKHLIEGEKILKEELSIDNSMLERDTNQKIAYIERHIENLHLTNEYNGLILELIQSAESSMRFMGKKDNTVWAGSICYVYEQLGKKIKKELGNSTNVTPSTFNTFIKTIDKYKEEYEEVLEKIELEKMDE